MNACTAHSPPIIDMAAREDRIAQPWNQLIVILAQRSHLLQVLDDSHVRVHEAVHTVAHAGFLSTVQRARGNLARDTLLKAGIGEAVNGC